MKKIFLSIVLTLCLFAVHTNVQAKTPQDSVAYREVMTELLTMSKTAETYQLVLDQMFNGMSVPLDIQSALKEKVFPIIYSRVIEISMQAYQKYLSIDDLRATIDFYKTPAGKRILEAQPLIASEVVSRMGEIMKEINPIMMEVMQQHKNSGNGVEATQ